MRLARFLALAGVASRRQAEKYITAGKVTVNGNQVVDPAFAVDEKDRVEVDGQRLKLDARIYLLLYKPPGYITTVIDPQGRPKVVDLIPQLTGRVYPVGRLDQDTAGLLLLTNDGEFANLIMHPRYEIKKTYQALVAGKVSPQALRFLRQGVALEDGMTAPARAEILQEFRGNTLLEIEIHEGRKRQVKRMCAAVGYPVLSLTRTGLSFLHLDGLKPGQYRYLTDGEVERMKRLARTRGRER